MLIGGPAILVLSEMFQRSFGMQLINFFQLLAVVVFVAGAVVLVMAKKRCANCGYIPNTESESPPAPQAISHVTSVPRTVMCPHCGAATSSALFNCESCGSSL